MQRDPDVLRRVLLEAEGGVAWTDPTIVAHARLLHEAGYLSIVEHRTLRSCTVESGGLTWRGAEVLDAIRLEAQWAAPFELMVQVAFDLSAAAAGLKQIEQESHGGIDDIPAHS